MTSGRSAPGVLIALLLPFGASALEREARLTRAQGQVTWESGGEPVAVRLTQDETLPLEEGDLIRTGADGEAEVVLDGDTVLDLGPGSVFKAESLDAGRTVFGLELGRLIALVKKLGARDRFEVKTPMLVAAVRGTEFAVEQMDDQAVVGVLDEGELDVTGENGPAERLGPNQESQVFRGRRPSPPGKIKHFHAARSRAPQLRERRQKARAGWRAMSSSDRQALRQRHGHSKPAPKKRSWRPFRGRPAPAKPPR